MVDLEELEMSGLGEADGFDFESLYGEEGEQEDFFDYEDFEFDHEEESWGESYESLEADPFVGSILSKANRILTKSGVGGLSPAFFQQLATQAAKVAGGAVAGKTGADIATQIAGKVLREGDYESWGEAEGSFEGGAIDPETLDEMQYNAYQASEAASEAEGDYFLADLVGPLISGLASGESSPSYEDLFEDGEAEGAYERDEFLPALLPLALPFISKGVGAIGKLLNKNKSTRKLTRCLPKVLNESLAEAESYRRPLSQRDVAGILGRQSARAFGNQAAVGRALRQNRVAASRAQMRPSPMRWQGPRPRGPMAPAPFGPAASRPPSGQRAPRRRNRGPVVGYMLKPIYARPRR